MLLKKRPLTNVVLRNSCSTLSTTSDKARQIIGWTLVCVSIHLECWLNKTRAKNRYLGCSGCGMPTAIQFNSVSKFGQCECDPCGLNSHSMRIRWMWIQFVFKQNQVWKGLIMHVYCMWIKQFTPSVPLLASSNVICLLLLGGEIPLSFSSAVNGAGPSFKPS